MRLAAKTVLGANGTLCFEVKYKDRPYKVKLYKFQENYPDGTIIDCVETVQANGDIYLRQDHEPLLRQFYEPGGEYDFEVKYDFTHNGYYGVLDGNGFQFRVPVPGKKKLLLGTTVRCTVKKIDRFGATLSLCETNDRQSDRGRGSGQDDGLSADVLSQVVESGLFADGLPMWDIEELFELLFVNEEYYDNAVRDRLLRVIHLWRGEGHDWTEITGRLEEMIRAVMFVLEGSTVLHGESAATRKTFQHRLSVVADNLTAYKRATEALADGTHDSKVERVLNGLRTSGYVYEAERQLDLLMRVFSLSPEAMESRLADIFSIIHHRPEEFWKDEPFRKAFIRLLELFIVKRTERLSNIGTVTEQDARPLVEALSIQLLLADPQRDADAFDYNLNVSALYRHAAAIRTSTPSNAVRNAFLALMDVTRTLRKTYQWEQTDKHDLLASLLTGYGVAVENPFEKWYANRQVVLRADPEGLTVFRNDVADSELRTVTLPDVGIWGKLKVKTPHAVNQLRANQTLKEAREIWGAIEKALFIDEERYKVSVSGERRPEKGEECLVRVTGQVSETLFEVEVSEEGMTGRGLMKTEDMAPYNLRHITQDHFRDKDGNPYVFPAEVKAEENGVMYFTVKEYLLEYAFEEVSNTRELVCVIKSKNKYGTVGISEQGDPVRFAPTGLGAEVNVGAVVKGCYWQRPEKKTAYIDGTIIEVLDKSRGFTDADAFSVLLRDFCGEEVYTKKDAAAQSGADTADSSDFLSDARMHMLLNLIETKAASESDYMRAFNQIGLARLLARLVRADGRKKFYNSWMRLIDILHDFAANGKIDGEMLYDFEKNDRSNFDTRSELYRRYLMLKTVSYKGRPEMRAELWELMEHGDEEIRKLAENVMAYNLVSESASMTMLGEISDRINNILHVKSRKTTLYQFGSEGKTVEFKTSLVYPPNNHMRPDPDTQSLEIMKEVCALLNAEGGTLYVGVNDFGMGVGIENDLAFKRFEGSEDKLDLFFRRRACEVLGKDVDAYLDSSFVTYGPKRIYVVKVKPYFTEPVMVEGRIYERHGSSKLLIDTDADIKKFRERRKAEGVRR